jgi:hypothetical protein
VLEVEERLVGTAQALDGEGLPHDDAAVPRSRVAAGLAEDLVDVLVGGDRLGQRIEGMLERAVLERVAQRGVARSGVGGRIVVQEDLRRRSGRGEEQRTERDEPEQHERSPGDGHAMIRDQALIGPACRSADPGQRRPGLTSA